MALAYPVAMNAAASSWWTRKNSISIPCQTESLHQAVDAVTGKAEHGVDPPGDQPLREALADELVQDSACLSLAGTVLPRGRGPHLRPLAAGAWCAYHEPPEPCSAQTASTVACSTSARASLSYARNCRISSSISALVRSPDLSAEPT